MRLHPWFVFLFACTAASAQQLESPPEKGPLLELHTVRRCDTLDVVITLGSRYAASIRSVSLESAENVWLDYPAAPKYGDTTFSYRAIATNRSLPATGTMVLTDRSGNAVKVPYDWHPSVFESPGELCITQSISTPCDTTLTLTNTGTATDTIVSIALASRRPGISLIAETNSPRNLEPGENLSFDLRVVPTDVGTVHDTVVVTFPCQAVRIPVNVTGTGTVGVEWQRFSAGMRLSAAPNPASETAHITLQGFSGSTTVDILDGAGRLVERLMENGAAHEPTMLEWSSEGMASGRYYCVVTSANGRSATPIVVTH